MRDNFQTFNDIKHIPLRVYNRVVLMANLLSDFGPDASAQYAEIFNKTEMAQMRAMMSMIEAHGVDAVKKTVLKGVEGAEYNAST